MQVIIKLTFFLPHLSYFASCQSRDGSDEEAERGRVMELEQRLIEAKLRQQQLQSEADSRWLHQEESNLVSYLQTFMTTMNISCSEEEALHHPLVRVGAL